MSADSRLTRRKVTVSLALSLLAGRAFGSSASAQERGKPLAAGDRITRLDRQMEDLRQALKIPGISAAIVKDRKLQWAKGFGSADTENKIPAAPETNYRIASLTKTFASTLLMQLVEGGKLDLDEPMAKYSPGFQQRFGRGPTVRHVFTPGFRVFAAPGCTTSISTGSGKRGCPKAMRSPGAPESRRQRPRSQGRPGVAAPVPQDRR